MIIKFFIKSRFILISLLIVNIFFFDGIYLNKSYIAFNYERALLGNNQIQSNGLNGLNLSPRGAGESWIDIGGAAYQSNVMPQITKLENSFIWSNRIATGNNLLYDFTFQPLSTTNLLARILNGGIKTLNIVFILLVLISTYYILLILTKYINLSTLSASVGAVIFVGNGFLSSGWSNHVTMPYILCPIYMYYLYGFIFKNKYKIIFPLIGLLFLLNTFIPTLILMIASSFIIYFQVNFNNKILKFWQFVLRFAKAIFLIAILSAFVYVPALTIANQSGSVNSYVLDHPYYHLPYRGLFLLLTPNLFLSNFNSLYINAYDWWVEGQFAVTYIGIISTFFILYTFVIIKKENIFIFLALIILLLRVFSDFLRDLFTLPLMQSISVTYYFSAIAYISIYLISINFDGIEKNKSNLRNKNILLGSLFLILALYYLFTANLNITSRIYNLYFSFSLIIVFSLTITSDWKFKKYIIFALIFLDLFMSQNFNKHDVRNLSEYKLPPTLNFIINESDRNYRVLNTTFNALPPSVDAALGINSVQSFGHLSIDKNYLRFFNENIGSDTPGYPIEGFTSCSNIKFNPSSFNKLSIKYIITDNGACFNIFKKHYEVLMTDSFFTIFHNPTSLPISSIDSQDSSCVLEVKKKLLSHEYKFINCYGEFRTNINYSDYFDLIVDDKLIVLDKNHIYKSIFINGTQTLKFNYTYTPAYIGFFISLFGLLFVILNKYYLFLQYLIYKLILFVKVKPI